MTDDIDGTPADRAALDAVADLIHDLQPDGMVQRFVLLVETIDGEARQISGFTTPGQMPWDTFGLLHFGLTMEEYTTLMIYGDGGEGDAEEGEESGA